ncbi:hypothetical protein H2202_001673 [Exophiala xenobiotica]|nr:hypothetical protein H2202_001673 [Exophiala xenobiotica]KAK5210468.1 hypothetical protein LTR41_004136 [Exophiala xenobiotica]KAK5228314.1 hypothetical protein LTR72_002197 [Exophiala xenobiotica]KAK5302250.1 hypothetical protein LTR14_000499 [Exophiala xenobiotica]KAK5409848.1 hypothetical protein LTR06_006314 [Exophiala xenobiotica]
MATEACCTCATLLTEAKVPYDPSSEKPLLFNRRLSCCSREICALCQYKNPRFQSYCPFCQISSGPSALPKEGLRLPPSYTRTAPATATANATVSSSARPSSPPPPPPYEDHHPYQTTTSTSSHDGTTRDTHTTPPENTDDTIHHISPDDSLASLSLAYKVPVPVLRSHNNLYSDSLLAARKYIFIPRTHYDGPPLSTPPDPDEEARKTKLRRWMVATKCADYSVATLYLKGSDYNLDLAVEAFKADEEWEKSHPLKGKGKDSRAVRSRFGQRGGGGSSISGQLSQ